MSEEVNIHHIENPNYRLVYKNIEDLQTAIRKGFEADMEFKILISSITTEVRNSGEKKVANEIKVALEEMWDLIKFINRIIYPPNITPNQVARDKFIRIRGIKYDTYLYISGVIINKLEEVYNKTKESGSI